MRRVIPAKSSICDYPEGVRILVVSTAVAPLLELELSLKSP